jgi:N-alpha-acetyltransferase 35, NatC auxiliary subunit
MGYPLSQTLFTSLHINVLLWPEPKALIDSRFTADQEISARHPLLHLAFRSYCLALIKACDLARDTVTGQHFYEVR